ncbi:MAG: hypothetical protein ACXWUP_11510 [Allosphingosinicella sp.]
MPATITLGHVLMLLAAFALLAAIASAITALRHRGYGRGTPQYARARTARRSAVYALALALAFGLGCLTPLCEIAILGSVA